MSLEWTAGKNIVGHLIRFGEILFYRRKCDFKDIG